MSLANRIRIREVRTLSDDWYLLKKTTFDWQRSDGTWQTINRETYDRGNGATLLPFDPVRRTVLLTRQFRYPAYVNGHDSLLIETAAGLLDGKSPDDRIRMEVEEELGLRLHDVRKVFACFMSPGSVTEQLYFFVGQYDASMRTGVGGGSRDEGEDIEVLEPTIDEALRMIEAGRICDGKTVILLQYAALNLFASNRSQARSFSSRALIEAARQTIPSGWRKQRLEQAALAVYEADHACCRQDPLVSSRRPKPLR